MPTLCLGSKVLQDLVMPGSHVDVNLHPTKREVGFLHQDELLEAIRGAVEETLLTSNDKQDDIPSLAYHNSACAVTQNFLVSSQSFEFNSMGFGMHPDG